MARRFWLVLLGLLLTPLGPAPARAQLREAAIGGALGVAGGGVATLSIVVARARFQGKYLDSPEDLIHWQTTPLIVAPLAGVAFGLAGEEVLRGSIVGSTTGLLAGAATGAALAVVISDEAEAPWAGGVIGGGVGLTLGGLFGALRAWLRDDSPEAGSPAPARFGLHLPL